MKQVVQKPQPGPHTSSQMLTADARFFLFVHGFGVPRASRKNVFHSGMHDDLEGHVDGSCWRAASVPVEEQRSCGLMDKALPS